MHLAKYVLVLICVSVARLDLAEAVNHQRRGQEATVLRSNVSDLQTLVSDEQSPPGQRRGGESKEPSALVTKRNGSAARHIKNESVSWISFSFSEHAQRSMTKLSATVGLSGAANVGIVLAVLALILIFFLAMLMMTDHGLLGGKAVDGNGRRRRPSSSGSDSKSRPSTRPKPPQAAVTSPHLSDASQGSRHSLPPGSGPLTPQGGSLGALCPGLVLANCEAWFAVKFDDMLQGAGSFNVLGLSGNPLLRAIVSQGGASGSRSIAIAMTPARTLATVIAPAEQPGTSFEVRTASQQLYGELRQMRHDGSQYSFATRMGTLLSLDFDMQRFLLIRSNADGQTIARAARCTETDFFRGVEHLEVRAKPGVDAVLVLCCVLAITIFGDGSSRLPSIGSM